LSENPFLLFLGPVGVWSIAILFFVWSAYAIQKEARTYLKKAPWFEMGKKNLRIQMPPWWQERALTMKGRALMEMLPSSSLSRFEPLSEFCDPKGEGLLVILFREAPSERGAPPEEQFLQFFQGGGLQLDHWEPERLFGDSSFQVWEVESRSTHQVGEEEPLRLFFRANWVLGEGFELLFLYRTGVLAGLVDGYFWRKSILSLKRGS